MPDFRQVNASASALSALPNSAEFRHGVEILRHACAATPSLYQIEVDARAAGLLIATAHPDTQAGIIALAVMLLSNPDNLVAVARNVRAMMMPELPSTERVVLIEE